MTVKAETDPTDAWGLRAGDPITPELSVIERLGGGNTYEAYLAFDEITYSPVVVKMLRPHVVDDAPARKRMQREIDCLAIVNHPVVVRALRHDVECARPHLVLEQIDGPRLSSLIRQHGALPEQQYLPLGIELAAALHYLRRVDYVHLDVKPSNVIMGAPARLIDLSVARRSQAAARLTTVIGTPSYLAPEQCAPPETGTPGFASDVWGLGATLFHAIAGYRAFARWDKQASGADRFPQLRDEPKALPGRVPQDVADLVYWMLDPDPARRPLPQQVAEALQPALERQPRPKLNSKLRMI